MKGIVSMSEAIENREYPGASAGAEPLSRKSDMYGIYLHVPFCVRKCPYCDFYSVASGAGRRAEFLRALGNQIASFPAVDADTVYFGGGTPSLLSPDEIAGVLSILRGHHRISKDAEVSMECNPATVTVQTLREYCGAGVNRISIGCQSFQPHLLKRLGRLHSDEEAVRTVTDAREAGFDNISIDLMLGIPDATPETTLADARAAVSLPVDHVSAYILKICEGTPFADGVPGIPDDDVQAECYLTFSSFLTENGFSQYEISNFARSGKECRHNRKYWSCGQWLGYGPAAHMSDGGNRYSYPRDLQRFIREYRDGPVSAPLSSFRHEGVVDAEEMVMLGLRTSDGISLEAVRRRFGWELNASQNAFLTQCERGGLVRRQGDLLRLTREGFLVSNSVLSELFLLN